MNGGGLFKEPQLSMAMAFLASKVHEPLLVIAGVRLNKLSPPAYLVSCINCYMSQIIVLYSGFTVSSTDYIRAYKHKIEQLAILNCGVCTRPSELRLYNGVIYSV